MTIFQLITILNARRRSFFIIFCIVVGVAIIYVLIAPKTYTATSSVLVQSNEVDPLTGVLVPGQLLSGYVATQVDIISSHNVALKVVKNLNLIVRTEYTKALSKLDKDINPNDWLADEIAKGLDVKPSKESSVINIAYSGTNPQNVAELANAFASAYIQASLELKVAPAKTEAAWFDQQTNSLRETFESAQRRLSDYQQATGMIAPDEKLDLESARLSGLSEELVKAQSETYDSKTRQQQIADASAKGRLDELPDIQNNTLIQGLKSELSRAEVKLAEMSNGMSSNHPTIQRLRAETSSLKQKIAAEIQTAKGSMDKASVQSKMRESEIEQAFTKQKSRVLEFKKQHDHIALLKREVDSAQKSYDMARQRTEQIRLESQLSQTKIAILNSAIRPVTPSKPKKSLTISIAMILGILLGSGCAFIRETMDRRIRSEIDFIELLDTPLLMTLSDSMSGDLA